MAYTLEDLRKGIVAADAAGDTEGVKALGAEYRRMQQQEQEQAPAPEAKAPEEKPKVEFGVGGEILGGVVEPVLAQATGFVAKPVSEVAGLAATGYEMATGGRNATQVPEFQKEVQRRLTYEPRTEAGASPLNPLVGVPLLMGKAVGLVTPERAAPGEANTMAGATRNLLSEAVPQAISIGAAKLATTPLDEVAQTLKRGARRLMHSSLKPTLRALKTGDAAVAIDTMLEEGVNLTPKGAERLRARVDQINDEISASVAASPAKVDLARVARPLVEKLREFRKQVNPNADVATIKSSWTEFKNHPLITEDEIPVGLAQELKQGTYRQLAKKYGEMGSADVEAQKAIARGLKEQVAAKVPAIEGLNAEESRLLTTLSVVERRILVEANKNPMGLSLLAKNPEAWAAFLADRSGLFKSLLARVMNNAGEKLSAAARSPASKAAAKGAAMTIPMEAQRQYKMEEAQ